MHVPNQNNIEMIQGKLDQQKSLPNNDKVYVREADGTSYEADYNGQRKLSQILLSIYQTEMPNESVLICKGKLLDLQRNLLDNGVKAGEVIHLRKKLAASEQRVQSFIFISFKDKLHKIQLNEEDPVMNFKLRVQSQTEVPVDKQVILYNGQFLEQGKTLKDYNVKNEDIMNMGRVGESNKFPQRIFPMKMSNRNRRGSEGEFKATSSAFEPATEEHQAFFKSTGSTGNVSSSNNRLKIEESRTEGQPNLLFGPTSSQVSEEEDVNFNLEGHQWVDARSEEGSSPMALKNTFGVQEINIGGFGGLNKNVFATKGNFEVKALQFMNEGKNDDDKLNLEAFKDLLDPIEQEIVFCESYYEKGDGEENDTQSKPKEQEDEAQSKQKAEQGESTKQQRAMAKRESKQDKIESSSPLPPNP